MFVVMSVCPTDLENGVSNLLPNHNFYHVVGNIEKIYVNNVPDGIIIFAFTRKLNKRGNCPYASFG